MVVRLNGIDAAGDLRGPLAGRRSVAVTRTAEGAAHRHQRFALRARQGRSATRAGQRRAAEAGCTLAYVNMVGGQDELVFDGDSVVVAADGAVLARAPQFEETCLVVDLELPQANPAHMTGSVTGR